MIGFFAILSVMVTVFDKTTLIWEWFNWLLFLSGIYVIDETAVFAYVHTYIEKNPLIFCLHLATSKQSWCTAKSVWYPHEFQAAEPVKHSLFKWSKSCLLVSSTDDNIRTNSRSCPKNDVTNGWVLQPCYFHFIPLVSLHVTLNLAMNLRNPTRRF